MARGQGEAHRICYSILIFIRICRAQEENKEVSEIIQFVIKAARLSAGKREDRNNAALEENPGVAER